MFLSVFLLSIIVYINFYMPKESNTPGSYKDIKEVSIRVLAGKWEWSPKAISAKLGDKIVLKIYNEDNFFHGFALDAFNINKKLDPKKETTIEFIINKTGRFNYYCSIPCGEGHYNQKGEFNAEEIAIEESKNNLNGLLIVTDAGISEARMK